MEDHKAYHFMIGFVGPLGAGCTTAAEKIQEVFEEKFAQFINPVCIQLKVSDWFREHLQQKIPDWEKLTPCQKRAELQKIGNEWRQEDNKSIADYAIERSMSERQVDDREKPIVFLSILDSLKNPAEVARLREIYGKNFYLIGITADLDVRWGKRLQKKPGWGDVAKNQFINIDDRDRLERDTATGDKIPWGQRVGETFLLSDYFIINNGEDRRFEELKKELRRVLDICFSNPFLSPDADEVFMHEAWAAGCRSLCLSRQVGAAIADSKKNLISIGWNEVPQYGGGLYSNDSEKDCRCASYNESCRCDVADVKLERYCRNNRHQEKIIEEIINNLGSDWEKFAENEGFAGETVRRVLGSSRIKDLLEFSRAVHAEMEALISVARTGSQGLSGATMYVTTQPCHVCARHIVAAGIEEVVFIEPYYKSLAQDLHGDALIIANTKPDGVVWFRQYSGVAPRRYLSTFKLAGEVERKLDGRKADSFSINYLAESSRLGYKKGTGEFFLDSELKLYPSSTQEGDDK